ncbi:MAG: hypothetical protein EOP84_20035 [Verrucomicrobiaceae bacterium]|nr:MAG: hypothetical protein EOP84_20035 [Verrucomicrobiaceae bacterium]
MIQKPTTTPAPECSPDSFDGRDELNLAEFPLSVLSKRSGGDSKILVFEDQIWDSRARAMVARKVTVSGSAAYGLPTALDEDVLLALIQLTKHQAFSAKRVYFSRSQLIRMLGWEENGQSYARILSALNKWLGVNVMWNKAWRDYTREDAVWEDNGIVLIQDFQLKRGANACHITWADQMFESFLSGSVKALDFGLYRRLGTATAKRMYRFLDKRFYTRSALVFDLATFAHEKIGIKRTCAVYNLKGMLKPAIKELVAVGFLKDASDKERYRKREPGKWDVCFELAVADNRKDSIPLVEEETGNIPSLERELTSRGVTKSRARRLVGKCSDELVKAKIEEFDFLMSRKGKEAERPQNPGGWLAQSIQEGYETPTGYESAEQRQRHEKAIAAKAEKAAAKARKEQQTASSSQHGANAIAARVQVFLDRLPAAAREAIEAEALAASPLGSGAIQRPYMREAIIRNHVETLLGASL